MTENPAPGRQRHIKAIMQRSKADILNRVGGPEAGARLDDHRIGMHANPMKHQRHCWACLAWCRLYPKRARA